MRGVANAGSGDDDRGGTGVRAADVRSYPGQNRLR